MTNASASQCGDTREVKITTLANFQVATVEFSDRVRFESDLLVSRPDRYAGKYPRRLNQG
jgi:hypothetical protein